MSFPGLLRRLASPQSISVPGPPVWVWARQHPANFRGKGQDVKVFPYYSTRPSDSDVYHDYGNCPTGQQAPWQNKAQGTNGYRRCAVCTDMDFASRSTQHTKPDRSSSVSGSS